MYFAFFLDEHMMSTVTVEVWTPESELEKCFFLMYAPECPTVH